MESSFCRTTQNTIMQAVAPDDASDAIPAKRLRRSATTDHTKFSISRLIRSDICDECPLNDQHSCFIEASQTLFDDDEEAEASGAPVNTTPTKARHPSIQQLRCTKIQCYTIPSPGASSDKLTPDVPGTFEPPEAFRTPPAGPFQISGAAADRTTPNAGVYTMVAQDNGINSGGTDSCSGGELLPDERLFVSNSMKSVAIGSIVRRSDGIDDCYETIYGSPNVLLNDHDWWERRVSEQSFRIDGLLSDLTELWYD